MATDFFQQQDKARRNSALLIGLFCAAVVAIVLVIYLIVVGLLARVPANPDSGSPPSIAERFWQPELFLGVSLGTLAVISLGTLYKISEVSAGGEKVALMLGGRRVNPNTRDPAERRLLNVIEEMALASGTPVPPVYVLDDEPAINAFAAGHTPSDAVVAVSRGALDYLTRDELQGVMGHEFSHILNGDMRLNLRLIGLLHGILLLAIIGYYVVRIAASGSSSRRSKNEGGLRAAFLLIGLALIIIGYIGVFFGQLIKAAVSRQREFLADASAVQFTRYPAGIAGALKKIGALSEGSTIRDGHAEECSHLFFCDALSGKILNLFSTHPPLIQRVKRLDPGFDGIFPKIQRLSPDTAEEPGVTRRPAVRSAGGPGARTGTRGQTSRPLVAALAGGAVSPPNMIGVGEIELGIASTILDRFPEPLREAGREPFSARAVIYALLSSPDPSIRAAQWDALKSQTEPLCYRRTEQLAAICDRLPAEVRLPLVDFSLPALKQLSPSQYASFRQVIESLVLADRKIDLFEYLIRTVVLRYLDLHFGRSKPPSIRYTAINALVGPLSLVFSILSRVGDGNPDAARKTFDHACEALGRPLKMLNPGQYSLTALDAALNQLAQATPMIKKRVLAAAASCVTCDRKVTVEEWELLRIIAAALNCPMPPIAIAETISTGANR